MIYRPTFFSPDISVHPASISLESSSSVVTLAPFKSLQNLQGHSKFSSIPKINTDMQTSDGLLKGDVATKLGQ